MDRNVTLDYFNKVHVSAELKLQTFRNEIRWSWCADADAVDTCWGFLPGQVSHISLLLV